MQRKKLRTRRWTMDKIKLALIALSTIIIQALGGWDMSLRVLVSFVIIDYGTGVMAAICRKEISSMIGYRGLFKKISMFIAVYMACLLGELLGIPTLRIAVISGFITNEFFSILENFDKIKLKYPKILDKLFEILKNHAEGMMRNGVQIHSQSHTEDSQRREES